MVKGIFRFTDKVFYEPTGPGDIEKAVMKTRKFNENICVNQARMDFDSLDGKGNFLLDEHSGAGLQRRCLLAIWVVVGQTATALVNPISLRKAAA